MGKVAIIGNTSWGITLGVLLAGSGKHVSIWTRLEEEARELNSARSLKVKFPDIIFPDNLEFTASINNALNKSNLVILAVPSDTMRENVRVFKDLINPSLVIVSASKGLEKNSTKRMSVVITEEIDPAYHSNICVLSGPNLSREIMAGHPATTVIAAQNIAVAEKAQQIISSPLFRVYINDDVTGVELAGAMKNVIALSAGMSDGLGYGDNAKAALITRGLAEISRLGVAIGAKPLTFLGLAGLGDLVATCSSSLSRNHYTGFELAKGRSLKDIMYSMTEVAEGINTTMAACKMSRNLGIEMPIAEQVNKVLFEGLPVPDAMRALMGRDLKHEMHGIYNT